MNDVEELSVSLEGVADMQDTEAAETLLCHVARESGAQPHAVNPSVVHASTILFPTLAAFEARKSARLRYGRRGTATSFALEDAVSALEGAAGTVLAPSGASAIAAALLAFAEPGRHVLVPDNVYGPCRHGCEDLLRRFGVEVTYYDPVIGGGIAALLRPETRLIWLESPGSQTFEVQDIPAILAQTRPRGIVSVIDNTWSGGLFLKPLAMGVDISLQAATKYISGHSDLMLGTLACAATVHDRVRAHAQRLGLCVGPDDAYLALRGLRTLAVRMRQHHETGLTLAAWLAARPEVARVMHPGLPDDPGHGLWRAQFTGASGLFGFVLNPVEKPRLAAMMDGLRLFGMGSSWGGYESLLIPTNPAALRSATRWAPEGQTMRLHAGLERAEDLIADLEQGFVRLGGE
ncbi:cystathionine beta-lyase [Roseomonas alba]|nr:cystathionine beta-lyase [Neoroseomonas alba]